MIHLAAACLPMLLACAMRMHRDIVHNKSTTTPSYPWERLSDRELSMQAIKDLQLRLEGSFLETQVAGLYRDLKRAGLRHFQPPVYLGDEWFSPEGAPVIAVPFFLAHPRLVDMERRFIGQAEGASPQWCRKLLRHEAGHCFDHAYQVSQRRRWQQLFGDRRSSYRPSRYSVDRSSLNYVQHLSGCYAQAHPDEDFAETFAVCISQTNWRQRYQGWPRALAKLLYVHDLIAEHADHLPQGDFTVRDAQASRLRSSLKRFYQRRTRLH